MLALTEQEKTAGLGLIMAAQAGVDLGLLRAKRKADGKEVALIVFGEGDGEGGFLLTPLAEVLIDGTKGYDVDDVEVVKGEGS